MAIKMCKNGQGVQHLVIKKGKKKPTPLNVYCDKKLDKGVDKMVEVTKLLEIHKYRDEGLTQKAVAERLGIHRNTKNIGTAKTKAILKTYRPKDALPK